MSFLSLCEWIQTTESSTYIREANLAYPIIGGIHLLAIALFGGMLLMVDARLLGWGMRGRPVSLVMDQFRAGKWIGFVVVITSGLLLWWSEPVRCYHSNSFWIKMTLLALLGVHAVVFRTTIYGAPEKLDHLPSMPGTAKLAASISVFLWAGLVLAGRGIIFW